MKGFPVLRAALEEGRRVRVTGHTLPMSWYHFEGGGLVLEDGGIGHFYLNDFFRYDWAIEGETPMTFIEAVAAMDRGEVVERPEATESTGVVRWRLRPGTLYYEIQDYTGAWDVASEGFNYDDVHATGWRIVPADALKNPRPTLAEAKEALRFLHYPSAFGTKVPYELIENALDGLDEHWPHLFRKAD